MTFIIKVQNLGKKFRIGRKVERYATLRESVVKAARSPLKLLGGSGNADEMFWALKNIDLDVSPGESVGIIGRNGAGKSTLLKILSRITEPTTGRVELYGRTGALLEVGTGFHPELTGRENIYLNGSILGMRRKEIEKKFDEIVEFAEIEDFLDTPVKRYSTGMYTRLAFAVAAHLETEILVVDEVLAVGDDEFQKKCLGKMKQVASEGRTVLFVSHNMTAVSNLCARGIHLCKGQIEFDGQVADAIKHYLNQSLGDEAEFISAPIKRASIKQIDGSLVLSADYEVEKPMRLPCLGFVVSDALGNPIFGSNPRLDNAAPLEPISRGTIRSVISTPSLVTGSYSVSLWFGDGVSDFFVERDCLRFDLVNTKRAERAFTVVGPIMPNCEWYFE